MPTSAELETQAAAMLTAIRDNIAKQPKAPAPPPFVFAEADRKADGRRSPDEDTIDNSNLQRALRESADEHLQRALRESAEEQARHARELDAFKNALAESLREPLEKPPVAAEDYNLQAAIMESIQATLEKTRKAVEGATRDPSTRAIATEALGYVDGRISQMLKMYMEQFTLHMQTRNRNEALTEKLEAAKTENAENAEKIGELTEKLEAAKTENAEKIGELTEKLEAAKTENVEKIGELTEKLKTANTEVTELEAQVGAANVQNDEQLEAKDAEKTKKIGELTQQLQTERDELTQQLTDAKAEKAENADTLQLSLNALINEKTAKDELAQQLQAQKDELEKQLAAEKVKSTSLVESTKKAFDETNAGLEKQLADERVKSTSLVESTKKAFDETTAGLEKQLADEKAAKAKLVTENGRLARQLEAEKVTADAELTEKLAVEKASLQKALDDLKNDLIGAQNTIVDSKARFEAEKAKAEELAKQIASAEVECTDAEVEAETAETAAEVAEVARGKKAETAAEVARGKKAKKVEKVEGPEGAAETGDSETESDMSTARDLSTYVAALKALGNLAHVSAFLKLGFGDSIASFEQLRGMPEFKDWEATKAEEFVDEAATYLGFSDTILADLQTKTNSVYLQAVIYGVRAWAKMMGERIVANTITGADFLFDEAIENGNTTAAIVLDMMRPDPSRSTEGATFEVWHAVPNRGKNRTVTNWADVGYVSTVKLDTKVRTIFQTRGPDFVNKFVKE